METQIEEVNQEALDAAAEAAFAAGFAGGAKPAEETPAVQSPAPDTEPAPTDEPAPATPAPAPAVVDPMASLPPEVRQALAQIPVLSERVTQLTRVAEKVPHLQSTIDTLRKAVPPPPPPKPQTFEKVEALRAPDGLPEVADAIAEITQHFEQRFAQQPAQEPTPTPTPAPTQHVEQVTVDADEAQLDQALPQWRQVGSSDAFKAWVKTQPDARDIETTSSPLKFAAAIGRYQAHTAVAITVNTRRQARAAAAVAPTSTARPASPAQETPEQAFEAGFNKGRPRK
jgi:hypothetical protein